MRSHSGPGWDGSQGRPGLVHGFLYNLCSAVTSCFYVFCCCWLIEDCFVGRRSLPRPLFESPDPGPPPPPVIGHQHQYHGLMGSIIDDGPPGPPPPPDVGSRPHGLLGSIIGGPTGPPTQPGPYDYPGAPPPYG